MPNRIVLKKLRRSSPSLTESLDPEVLNETIERLFSSDCNWNAGINSHVEDEEWRDEFDINYEELSNILRKCSSASKAPGMDGIKATFLKHLPESFIKLMLSIYNMYIRKGEFPKLWKRSILILIPKSELNLTSPKVRPICLLSELGKTLERVIENRIQDWMIRNPASRLAENQFRFRKKKSTCNALTIVQEFVLDARENREIVIGASLDVTNAFNTIKWSYIRQALWDKGFPLYIRRMVDSYLSEREIEFLTINGDTQTRQVIAGVPQDSVLGPTLWNIAYDQVLRTPIEKSCITIGYADDTFIMARASSLEEAKAKINLQLSRVLRRIESIGLKIAPNKTGAILFNAKMPVYNVYNVHDDDDDIYNEDYDIYKKDDPYNMYTIRVGREKVRLQNGEVPGSILK